MKRTLIARKALSLTVGISVLAGLSIAFSATSASADCQVLGITSTPGLEGVLCSSGDGSGSGAGAPGGPTNTGCLYDMRPLDDDWGEFTNDEYTEKVTATSDGGTFTRRTYEKEGKVTGTYEVTISADNKAYGIWAYSKKMKQAVGFDCRLSSDGPIYQDIADDDESDSGENTAPAAPLPTSTATPVNNPVAVSDWVTHVAGTANNYALKLGFTNTGSTSTYVDAAFDMTALSSADVISGPAGLSCSTKAGVQLCEVPELAPGASTTIFLRVSAPAAVGAEIPVTILNKGSLLWKQSAARPTGWSFGPLEQTFLVTRP